MIVNGKLTNNKVKTCLISIHTIVFILHYYYVFGIYIQNINYHCQSF